MDGLTIRPLHWARLRDLHQVAPLDRNDLACMAELRQVLERHGRLERFALHLVHKHFDLADHEILVAYSDAIAREQRCRVEARDTLRDAVPTTWTFDRGEPGVACVCAYSIAHGHLGRHRSGRTGCP